ILIVVLAISTILAVTWLFRARFYPGRKRTSKRKNEKLPSLFSWKHLWGSKRPDARPRRDGYSTTLQANELEQTDSRDMSGAMQDPERAMLSGDNGVGRNTSVRSVMTLPAYSPAARENERILGREGERAGIDTVVEFPEGHDEEEARREAEMASLYQIRLARRQEQAEREARRQARREARARGDVAALAEIRRRAEEAADISLSQVLIAEHQGANRERRVPSVQYADLGIARHDGTRLRASSNASDRSDHRPLLDSAASISGQSSRSRAVSNNSLQTHYRAASASSLVSSRASSEFDLAEPTGQPRGTYAGDFEEVSLNRRSISRSRSASRGPTPLHSPSIEIPRDEAPAYEDPPNYESPVATRPPQLPRLETVPSIQITSELTPVDGPSRP
ncbi:hypothetical protein M011DRAFT_393041, partial [Sporormia fimetaria CBS 119925]